MQNQNNQNKYAIIITYSKKIIAFKPNIIWQMWDMCLSILTSYFIKT
jgi:hypothetical protein